ncbi:MAG: DUF3570 domain-containing protein [Crocinitomicaceae bacterium]|nr:DUF3570 domain-containing protein [Flavobacteriales bacterium]NQZ37241.1 DUF3570 domain-containing protein [Crocinitomicaceae bacterium]
MWMQLIKLTTIALALFGSAAIAQDSTKIHLDPIEINIIANYYEQTGNHSPVTGGEGTEVLNNIAPSLYVHVPLDSIRTLDVNGGVDFYSSASSDNIDNPYVSSNHISGASSGDTRGYLSVIYGKKNLKKNTSKSYMVGGSTEFDVISLSTGFTFSKENKKKGRDFSISGKYFLDNWKLIYPVELRNGTNEYLALNKRHTVGLTLTESFIVNKRLKGAITVDGLGQFGLLSTPFHRVYMQNQEIAEIEILPISRIKVPVGLRLNAYLGDRFIVRTFNRVYWDTWDVKAFTSELEVVVKVTDWLKMYPLYRYHIQSQARYFAPYGVHTIGETFFTSDYDLSGFSAHKFGGGIDIAPLYGISRVKLGNKKLFLWKSVSLRYVNYLRSDGLKAWALTAGFDFKIER